MRSLPPPAGHSGTPPRRQALTAAACLAAGCLLSGCTSFYAERAQFESPKVTLFGLLPDATPAGPSIASRN